MSLPDTDVQVWGRVSRAKPQAIPETQEVPARTTRYGALVTESIVPTKHVLSDEGSYFMATNPTPGTAIAYGSAGTQASFSDTVPFMIIKNGDTSSAIGKRLYIDYLKLIQIGGTAPATTTSVNAALKIDSKNRDPTAGTLTSTIPQNMNADDATGSVSQILVPAGAVATIPAASSAARLVGRALLKGGPTLLLDEYTIQFGGADHPPQGGYLTTVSSYVTRMGPLVIGPQENAVLYLWFPGGATNPFSFEFELGLWER